MRILVAEDDNRIANFLVKGLKEEGYAVDRAADGEDALFMVSENRYDALILDRLMPKRDGIEVVAVMRSRADHTPVLMLTALDEVESRVEGLDAGADDYLTKPFAFSELQARLRSLLRRRKEQAPTRLKVGLLEMDLLAKQAMAASKLLDLTAREFAILEYFMRNPDRPLRKTEIYEHVWGDYDRWSNVVDVHLTHLRAKIESASGCQPIETVRGVGYVLRETAIEIDPL
ncbi:MAG: response regulator transcription factor [Candidatus Aquicultorales bacterium]